jgi:hypothetical protein
MKNAMVLACALFILPGALSAQDASKESAEAKREDRLKTLEEQVRALAAEVEGLRGELKTARESAANAPATRPKLVLASAPYTRESAAAAATPEPPQGSGTAQTQVFGGATSNAKLLNPDISVIGDFLGTAGHNSIRPIRSLEMHESELGLQAIIDPYARGDFFLSFGEQGVNVEEGYLTFTSLPGGFVAKVGKMRAAFGKVNTIHNHALEWTDRPMVTDNLLGGEDGIDDAGLSVTRILPAPKWIFMEATGQVFRGDSSTVFQSVTHKDVSYVGHIRAYKDLSESANVDIGASYSRGHSAAGADLITLPSSFHTNLYGMDATFRWKPLRRAIYHSFLARSELVWSQRDQLSPLSLIQTQRAFGFFTSGEYRLTRRWTMGGRFDRTGRAQQSNLTDTGFSALLTYWPSEFSQIRGQYRFARYAEGTDGSELRFQFLFVLGAHGAHPF